MTLLLGHDHGHGMVKVRPRYEKFKFTRQERNFHCRNLN